MDDRVTYLHLEISDEVYFPSQSFFYWYYFELYDMAQLYRMTNLVD